MMILYLVYVWKVSVGIRSFERGKKGLYWFCGLIRMRSYRTAISKEGQLQLFCKSEKDFFKWVKYGV